MNKVLLFALMLVAMKSYAQTDDFVRKGFVFGVGVGGGTLLVKDANINKTFSSPTLPNFKIGYMVNQKLEAILYLPGGVYQLAGKDRGFEAFQLGAQYWLHNKWWAMAAAGPTFDAPAFYTVKEPSKAKFYTGFPSLSVSTGYEIWRRGRFALDVQYRFFYGKSNVEGAHREGVSNMILLGFNWY